MNELKTLLIAAVVLWGLMGLGINTAAAQAGKDNEPDYVPDSAKGIDDGTKPGWHPMLKASANFALGQNKNVPGNPDGLSINFGYIINGALDYLSDTKEHEWMNTLLWQLGYTRTQVVDAMLKSVDGIDFKSTYLYHLPKLPWFGPFVAFRLNTAMLPGYEVRPGEANVIKLDPDEEQLFEGDNLVDENGNQITAGHESVDVVKGGNKIDLTGPFAPLTLRESVGAFAVPVDKSAFKLDIRMGFGAWETFVRNGYVVEDNDATADFLELRQMQDSVQLGPELGITATGSLLGNMTYTFNALFMQPVYHTADTDLEGMELLNAEFEFLFGIKLWEYASLDYTFKAYKQPLIVDEWQIQNGILFSVNFTIIEGEKPAPAPAPECKPCDCPKAVAPTTPPADAVESAQSKTTTTADETAAVPLPSGTDTAEEETTPQKEAQASDQAPESDASASEHPPESDASVSDQTP